MLRHFSSTARRTGGLSSTARRAGGQHLHRLHHAGPLRGSLTTTTHRHRPGSHSKAASPVRCEPVREYHPNPGRDARPRSRRIAEALALGLAALFLAPYMISWKGSKPYEDTALLQECMSRGAAMKQFANTVPDLDALSAPDLLRHLLAFMGIFSPETREHQAYLAWANPDPALTKVACQHIHAILQPDCAEMDAFILVGSILVDFAGSIVEAHMDAQRSAGLSDSDYRVLG
ncbi:hypothetical protein B0H17DRAFT_1198048 [Mycena rosella]|uniref:Uncharacterized protein n=1 Tax=Mycena rosella TaxID=1033263 RepID=A0AAD7DPB5_MYCRO|nr:hypothetical protein B0H17DRAFT_1198048 [Mycena rosella]